MNNAFNSYIPNDKYESKEILDFLSSMEKVLEIIKKREFDRWMDQFWNEKQNKSSGYFDNYFLDSWIRSRKTLVWLSSFSCAPYMNLIDKFSKLFQVGSSLFSPQIDQISQDFWIDTQELHDGLLQKIVTLFRQSWEKIEKGQKIDLEHLDLQAQQMAFLFGKIKSKSLDIWEVPFFSYIEEVKIDENNLKQDASYKKMIDLYNINYSNEPEFLEKVKEFFEQKIKKWGLEFKTLYWDKTGETDFDKNPDNLIWFLYFSPFFNEKQEKIPHAKYLWWVNLNPNFQNSGVGIFIKKAIQDEFQKGATEIYLDVMQFSQAEEMWKKLWFEYVSSEHFLDRKDYRSLRVARYKLTQESFNQVFAKSR